MAPWDAVWNRQSSDRGQTGVDFVVGVAIFLLTTAFVFGFIPGVLAPFGEATATPLYGDRVVDDLAYDTLAGESGPGVLDTECTLAFFGIGTATECRFDPSDDHRAILGLSEKYDFNVSIQRIADDGSRLPLYGNTDGTVTESGETRLVTGAPVPEEYGSVTTVSRHVSVADTEAVLVVRVW